MRALGPKGPRVWVSNGRGRRMYPCSSTEEIDKKKKFYLGPHQSLLEISSSKHAEIILY
jgi:hypothetical protein